MSTPQWALPRPDRGPLGVIKTPEEIVLEQTSMCANACTFCTSRERKRHGTLSIDNLIGILEKLPEFDGIVGVSGNGDAFVLDDLPQRIHLIKKYWPKSTVRLATTFSIKRSVGYFREIFDAGAQHLDVSCFGHTRAAYKTMHGLDAFDVVCDNISNAGRFAHTHKLTLHLAVLADTAMHFGLANADMNRNRFINYAVRKGFASADSLHMTELHSMQGRRSLPNLREIRPPFPCSASWSSLGRFLHITWEGLVAPCPYLYDAEHCLGNLVEQGLAEIIDSAAYQLFYARLLRNDVSENSLCAQCVYPKHAPSHSELARMAAHCGRLLEGKEVYFWGHNEVYENYKFYFSGCRPVCVISTGAQPPGSIDGIPVRSPEDVLARGEKLPLVIFAEPVEALEALALLHAQYPRYTASDITLAQAKLQDWFGIQGL